MNLLNSDKSRKGLTYAMLLNSDLFQIAQLAVIPVSNVNHDVSLTISTTFRNTNDSCIQRRVLLLILYYEIIQI